MSATNKTQHYNLPQFVAGDIPAWMTDVNNAMATIDGAIYDVASDEATVGESVAQLGSRVTTAENTVASLGTTVQAVQGDVAENTADIGTLKGNVNGLGTRMTTVEGTVGTLGTTVQDVQGDVAENTTDISALDTRVTALEEGGSVEIPSWTLAGSVSATGTTGNEQSDTVTVPSTAKEILITGVYNDIIRSSVLITPNTDGEAFACFNISSNGVVGTAIQVRYRSTTNTLTSTIVVSSSSITITGNVYYR